MDERSTESTIVSNLGIAVVLVAVIGGLAFLVWRRTAPLSRWYLQKQRRSEERGQRGPNPQQNPGTAPI